MRHYTEDDLILYHYGETSRPHRVAAHLEVCEACRRTLAVIVDTLASVDALEVPERDERYGLAVWQQLRHRLPEQEPGRWAIWPAAAVVVTLMVAAFVAGRISSSRSEAPSDRILEGGPAMSELQRRQDEQRLEQGADERVRLAAIGDHLEQSERVLLELLNANGSRIDVSGQQAWASDLVDSNRLYRQAAERAGDEPTATVLDELERHLLEIVHGPSTLTPAELETVRVRLDAAALLFKVRILSNDLRDRQIATLQPGSRT